MPHIIGMGNVRLVEYYQREGEAREMHPEPYRQFRFETHEQAIQWLCDVANDCANREVRPLLVNVVWPGHEHYEAHGWEQTADFGGIGNYTQNQPRHR